MQLKSITTVCFSILALGCIQPPAALPTTDVGAADSRAEDSAAEPDASRDASADARPSDMPGEEPDVGPDASDASVTSDAPDASDARDASSDASDAADAADATPDAGPPEVVEVEPNGLSEQATAFVVGDVLVGRTDLQPERDWWVVDLPAGQMFELELLEPASGIELDVELSLRGVWDRELGATLPGARRQYFIPEGGQWRLNFQQAVSEEAYRFRTGLAAPPAPIDLPDTGFIAADLSNAEVGHIYEFTAGASSALVAEVWARRDPVFSNLDSHLIVWDATDSALVALNDDISGSRDSRLVFDAVVGHVYWLVVEGYWMPHTGDARYELRVSPQ